MATSQTQDLPATSATDRLTTKSVDKLAYSPTSLNQSVLHSDLPPGCLQI